MTGLGLTIFYIYALLTKLVQSRWMDMGQVLFRVFKSIKIQEKEKTRPTFTHLNWTSLVNKGFIIWLKRELFLVGQMPEIHSRQDGPIFLAWVANQNAVFVSPCLLVTQLYINNHIYYELSSRGKVCYFSIYVF